MNELLCVVHGRGGGGAPSACVHELFPHAAGVEDTNSYTPAVKLQGQFDHIRDSLV